MNGALDKAFEKNTNLKIRVKAMLLETVKRGRSIADKRCEILKSNLGKSELSLRKIKNIEAILARTELLPPNKRKEIESLIKIRRNQLG